MAGRDPKSARAVAVEALSQIDPVRDYAGDVLDHLLDRTEERQRATDLVFGTLRNLHAIDAVITEFSGRPTERITQKLLNVIRVGVYELAYSPATPTHSIVDEAVKTAKTVGGKKQTGFVNAVLRQVVRHIANRQADLSAAGARRTLVQAPEQGCEFDADFLPDPHVSPAAHLSACFSLPQWLVSEWLSEFGAERTRGLCLGSNRRPSLYVRVNALRIAGQDLLTRFQRAGVRAEIVPGAANIKDQRSQIEIAESPHCGDDFLNSTSCDSHVDFPGGMLKVTGPQSVTQLPGFAEGLFTVQDLSASQAVRVLKPEPGWAILDMCAAPGTKTTQLAEATEDKARIAATDIDRKRLEKVNENITRLGPKSITVIPYAQLEQGAFGPFDAILLDVPCSNTGVMARRIGVRFRIKPGAIENLAKVQGELLQRAADLLRPGGRICYSTCSIQRQENQDVIRDFLAGHDAFELARDVLTLPWAGGFDHDGTYVAVLHSLAC